MRISKQFIFGAVGGLFVGGILTMAMQSNGEEPAPDLRRKAPMEAQPLAVKPAKVLRHIVLYKFKETTTPKEVQEVIEAFSGLPKKIEGIVRFEHGPNVSTEGKSDGLTYGFIVTFPDEKALADYLVHPAHQEYVKVVKDRREKVVVFDYWAEK